jgi:RNA polymerase sigma-70 factor (ECF subfamily)
VDQNVPAFQNRAHFFAIAVHLMRQIIVDFARRHRSQKHGGGKNTSLEGRDPGAPDPFAHFLDLHEALDRLAAVDERNSRVIKRDLLLGEAWLRRELAALPSP